MGTLIIHEPRSVAAPLSRGDRLLHAVPVYRRLPDQGRLAPEGLRYVASWVTADLHRCFQVMERGDPSLSAQWAAGWEDLVELEIIPVVTAAEAMAALVPRL